MQFDLDFRSRQPIYIQIVEQVRQRVARGELTTRRPAPHRAPARR